VSKYVIAGWIILFTVLLSVKAFSQQLPTFAVKPVVCGSAKSLIETMEGYNLYPLLGAPAQSIVEVDNGKAKYIPVVVYVFINDEGKLMIVEHLINSDDQPMCQLVLGDGIEFDTDQLKKYLNMK